MSTSAATKTSPVALAIRIAWGATLLTIPGPVLRAMGGTEKGGGEKGGGTDEGRVPRRVMRVLGARHLLQAAAEARFGRPARQIGVATDIIHAATDIGLASFDSRWRRAALTDAVIAAGFAVLGVANR